MPNPLIQDRNVEFLMYELLDAEKLCELPVFSEHSRDTFDLFLGSARKVAREQLFPSYRALDLEPPELTPSGVKVHPQLKQLYPQLVELGILNATRPEEVGGQNLPALINAMASAYLMAGNLAVYAYAGLTTGAAPAQVLKAQLAMTSSSKSTCSACTAASGPVPWRSRSPMPGAA